MEQMAEPVLQVNLDSSPQVTRVGAEQTPVIIIDDFAANVSELINHACQEVRFELDKVSAYPGVRGPLAKSHVIATLKPLLPLLHDVYSIPMNRRVKPRNYVYSLVSIPENELRPLQRVPHADSNAPYYLAITHYLSESDHGGTGIFRHIPTGFENITEDRLHEYVRSADAFAEAQGGPPEGYITTSDEQYELFEVIDYKPNRIIMYPGSLLHSGLIKPKTDISSDPGTGRLTTNIFVDFE